MSNATERSVVDATTTGGGGGGGARAVVSETAVPTWFVCRSGVLLWGQLNTVIQGHNSSKMDTVEGPAESGQGGTILQHSFRFKVAAKKGRWKVEPAYIDERPIGFVCFHEGADGVDILRRAANVGISYHNDHDDREIVYVNRYDWSWHHDPNMELILHTLGIDESDPAARIVDGSGFYYDGLVSMRFMLLDEQGYDPLIRALKDGGRLLPLNYALCSPSQSSPFSSSPSPSPSPSPFGVHLSLGVEDSWERGWMAFSDGLLVGFVYDGNDTCLDLETSSHLSLGNVLVDGIQRRDQEGEAQVAGGGVGSEDVGMEEGEDDEEEDDDDDDAEDDDDDDYGDEEEEEEEGDSS